MTSPAEHPGRVLRTDEDPDAGDRCPGCGGILPGDGPDDQVCRCGTLWEEAPAAPAPATRCRRCHRPLTDARSRARRHGDHCAKLRGILPPRRLRIAAARPAKRGMPGQTDLLLLEPDPDEEQEPTCG